MSDQPDVCCMCSDDDVEVVFIHESGGKICISCAHEIASLVSLLGEMDDEEIAQCLEEIH